MRRGLGLLLGLVMCLTLLTVTALGGAGNSNGRLHH